MTLDLLPEARPPLAARLRWGWLLLVLAGPALYAALAHDIAATAYDAATVHVYQGVVFSQAIGEGVLYPRWVQFLHWGLGSPIFTFRAPLPYYAMHVLHQLGLPHPDAWRVLMALGLLAACAGAYLLVFSLTRRRWPSVAAAIVFLYAPYVLRNTFERGSPEAISLFLSPWVLWALVRLAQRPTAARFLLASLLWALCITSHVLGPLMLAPLAALLAAALAWRHRTVLPFAALLAGGLLTAFIWAPMVPEQANVHINRDFSAAYADPLRNPVPLGELLAPPAVYDVALDNNSDGERVGLIHAVLLLFGIPAAVYAWRTGRRALALWLVCALALGLALFWMLTAASDPVWRIFEPILERLQYRSRLAGLQALAVALVVGLSLTVVPQRWQPRLAGVSLALVVLAALPSLYVDLRHRYADFDAGLALAQVRDAEIRSGGTAFTYFGEFTPRWREAAFDEKLLEELGPQFDAAAGPLARPVDGVTVRAAQVRSASWDLSFSAARDTVLPLHLLYYPRWRATLDGEPLALRPEANTGYVLVDVPAGEHRLSLRYMSTPVESAGFLVSGATLLVLLALPLAARLRPGTRPQPATVRPSLSPSEAPAPVSAMAGAGHATRWISVPAVAAGAATPVAPPAATASHMAPIGASAAAVGATAPAMWLLVALTALLAFKIFYVDPHTGWLRCDSSAGRVCGAQATVDVAFAGAPSLVGYAVHTPAAPPGSAVQVDLTWQAHPGARPGLYSFVHVRNSRQDWPVNPATGSEIWAQEDHFSPGELLLVDWVPGKLYRDSFRLVLPSDMPPGTYFLEVGWFDPTTGEQLDPRADTVTPPLRVLWRSVLLPSIEVH